MDTYGTWIWPDLRREADQHCNFYESFFYTAGKVRLRISADSNYALWLNGKLADSGQYPDYPDYKILDLLDLTDLCVPGKNHIAITVWYYGDANMGYYPGEPGVLFELWNEDALILCSGEDTLSRLDPCYESGRRKLITSQLGFGFRYDLTQEDGWKAGTLTGFSKSRVRPQNPPFHPRPVEKCRILPAAVGNVIGGNGSTHFLLDLGREEVGFLQFHLNSSREQSLTVAYGEHIQDGGVRRRIDQRDFSVEFVLREGENSFTEPFRRFGCRYLELFSEAPIQQEAVSLLPVEYPLTFTGQLPEDPLRRKIYETAVRTLVLCMHDHYEDTPWREQGLYTMDSRNQMLCGYHAFSEYRFPRANLLLISKDDRPDGLLNICFPTSLDLTIPSFSLHYFTQVWEYTRYSGDVTLAKEVYSKLESVLSAFLNRMENGLVPNWEGACYWNFYEWETGLDGTAPVAPGQVDAALNCLLSLALQRMGDISASLGLADKYSPLVSKLNRAIREQFFDSRVCAFQNSNQDPKFSQLVNALAILCGAADEKERQHIAQKLTDPNCDWTPASLSMCCFVYDALLLTDRQQYRDHILKDIDTRYEKMLLAGATSFWETEEGSDAFDKAGSLSHGWSAMPVYYYSILL